MHSMERVLAQASWFFRIRVCIIISISISLLMNPRYGRDGANYTSRAIFDCYYDPSYNTSVVVDYEPKM